jgi:general secretion pathway protein K
MTSERGSALLTVLWLSAALSAIAFTVATTVRGETERTATDADSLRCYYLAAGAVERALLYIQWGGDFYHPPTPVLHFNFGSGDALAEIIPENSKLDINRATPTDLTNLLIAVGATPDRANLITQAILDWRNPSQGGSFTGFDQYYLSLKPSFRARHASFEEIEELLLVQGMTPELFYGHYAHDSEGRMLPVAGLKDCLSIHGNTANFNGNTIQPELMRAIGINPGAVAAITAARRAKPFESMGDLARFSDGSPGLQRLAMGVGPICTIRATARLRLDNGQYAGVQRSVSAMVRFFPIGYNPAYHVLRWYDNAWSAQ